MPTHSGRDGAGGRRGGAGTPSESLNEQIVAALARLQEDMQNVLERLHTLEALTASQVRHAAQKTNSGGRKTAVITLKSQKHSKKIQQLTSDLIMWKRGTPPVAISGNAPRGRVSLQKNSTFIKTVFSHFYYCKMEMHYYSQKAADKSE